MRNHLLIVLVSLAPALAWADAYKCTINGVVTYSAEPCGPDAEVITPRLGTGDPLSRSEKLADARETLRDVDVQIEIAKVERYIRDSQLDIRRYRKERAQDIAALRRAQRISANNLAGATRDLSIAQEMAAVNQRYASLIEQERAEIDMRVQERIILLQQR